MVGFIKDIILSKKRNKLNNIYGFVKTSSEVEEGKIISNLKQFRRLRRILRMSINNNDKKKLQEMFKKKRKSGINVVAKNDCNSTDKIEKVNE